MAELTIDDFAINEIGSRGDMTQHPTKEALPLIDGEREELDKAFQSVVDELEENTPPAEQVTLALTPQRKVPGSHDPPIRKG